MKPDKRDKCSNKDLKAKDSFTVDRIDGKDDPTGEHIGSDWVFIAKLENKVMSSFGASKGGFCNDAATEKEFRGCGLATILAEYCFTDDKVGGVDVQNHYVFKQPSLSKWRDMATKKCEHVVYLVCAPETRNYVECSAYLTAAINTKHTIMFVEDDKNGASKMVVKEVAKVQPKFKKDAAGWIENHGSTWFFCQCKPDTKGKCSIL